MSFLVGQREPHVLLVNEFSITYVMSDNFRATAYGSVHPEPFFLPCKGIIAIPSHLVNKVEV